MNGKPPFCKNSGETSYEIYVRILKGHISFPRKFHKPAKVSFYLTIWSSYHVIICLTTYHLIYHLMLSRSWWDSCWNMILRRGWSTQISWERMNGYLVTGMEWEKEELYHPSDPSIRDEIDMVDGKLIFYHFSFYIWQAQGDGGWPLLWWFPPKTRRCGEGGAGWIHLLWLLI